MENKLKYSYCGKCFTQEKDFEDISFEDDWDEIGKQCPKCKTDLYLTSGDVLPIKKPLIVKVGTGKTFDLNEWEKKRFQREMEQDVKLNEYIKDFGNFGKEVAERNYFKTTENA
jgi:hypothetical protein